MQSQFVLCLLIAYAYIRKARGRHAHPHLSYLLTRFEVTVANETLIIQVVETVFPLHISLFLSLYLRMCHLKIACTALCAFVSHLDDLGGSNVYNVGYSHYHLHIPILVKLAFNFHPIFECAENTVSNEIFNKFFYRIRKVVAINRHFSTSFFLFTLSAQCRFSVVTNAWHFMNLNVQMFVSRLKNTTNRIDSNLFKSITQERNKHSNMEIIINRSHLASSKDRWFNVYNVAPCVSHGMARLIYSNWSVSFCTYVCTK